MTSSAFWLCLRPDPGAGSVAERMVEAARVACLLDTAERAHDAGFAEIVVHTSAPELFEHVGGLSVQRTDPQAAIGSVVAAAALHATGPVCYAGAGMPAMTAADWQAVRERIAAGQAVANNVHSCDLLGVPHASSLAGVGCDPVDNGFARRVRDDAGLEIAVLERSAQTLLDLDTPADLAVLSLGRETGVLELGPRLGELLDRHADELAPVRERLARAFDVLTERGQQFMVIGRVGSAVWAALERDTAVRVRVISEERGMRARANAGQPARSLIGLHGEAVGAAALVHSLVELADAVIFDTRPLLAHLGWGASRADRFAADLGDPEAIHEPALRELVEAVVAARVPIALGGHSLVAGGLLAGIDIAWTRWERAAVDRPNSHA